MKFNLCDHFLVLLFLLFFFPILNERLYFIFQCFFLREIEDIF